MCSYTKVKNLQEAKEIISEIRGFIKNCVDKSRDLNYQELYNIKNFSYDSESGNIIIRWNTEQLQKATKLFQDNHVMEYKDSQQNRINSENHLNQVKNVTMQRISNSHFGFIANSHASNDRTMDSNTTITNDDVQSVATVNLSQNT